MAKLRQFYCRCGFHTTKRRKLIEHMAQDDNTKPIAERHWQISEQAHNTTKDKPVPDWELIDG